MTKRSVPFLALIAAAACSAGRGMSQTGQRADLAVRAARVLDVRSGQVTPLFTVSGWREVNDDFDAVVSRADSRLIVFRGARDEKGAIGNHYYLIEDRGRLKHLHSVDTDGNFEATPQIE